jgi:hypothetical protein
VPCFSGCYRRGASDKVLASGRIYPGRSSFDFLFARSATAIRKLCRSSGKRGREQRAKATNPREPKEKIDRAEWDKCEPSERAEQSRARSPRASSTRQCIEVNAPLGKLLESHSHQVCVRAVQRLSEPPRG